MWMKIIAAAGELAAAHDREWMRRRRVLNSLIVMLFVFRLVLSRGTKGYATVVAELWDQCRKLGIALPQHQPVVASVREVVELTKFPPGGEATHWTLWAMAARVGLAVSTVRKIWQEHGLVPHRFREFKLSNDPAFVDKLRDIAGLYVNPPEHAIVLSVDEKSQIQALGRT